MRRMHRRLSGRVQYGHSPNQVILIAGWNEGRGVEQHGNLAVQAARRAPRDVVLRCQDNGRLQADIRSRGQGQSEQKNVLKMHEEMLRQIKTFGRVHEIR